MKKYQVPTFIFINKTDVVGADVNQVIKQLQTDFADGCLPFHDQLTADELENIATTDDHALEQYLNSGTLTDREIQSLIKARQVFPVYTGAALKLTGVDELIAGLKHWTVENQNNSDSTFAAQVFKISHDEKGERLTWLRVLSGTIQAKTELLPGEKANQVRVYNGEKFTVEQTISAGNVCAVTGLQSSFPGQ
ncbi:GTP-binding protein, partial [Bartonella sp. TT110JLCBS]|uniref:GTP-binding protein n=1 Tax=Bartonella sp. TT110JLCBS TaxID=3243578 RepID=UPI0035CEB94C